MPKLYRYNMMWKICHSSHQTQSVKELEVHNTAMAAVCKFMLITISLHGLMLTYKLVRNVPNLEAHRAEVLSTETRFQ